MNRFAVSTLLMLTFAVGAIPASARANGVIEGTVSHPRGTADLVVFVANVPGQFPPSRDQRMDQKKMTFVPHVLPVVVGTTVSFTNSDAVGHNVYSPDNETYNLGTWPKGESRPYTFKKTGVYTQLCSIHPEMQAFIIVLQNPFFAVTKAGGHFTIPNVPPGEYVLKVWGEKLKKADKERSFPVKVTTGKTTVTLAF